MPLGGGDFARQFGVDALHRHVLSAVPDDFRLLEVGPRLEPESVLHALALKRPRPRLRPVPDERRLHGPWAGVGKFDAVPAFRVGGHPKPEVVLHQDGRAREGRALGVLDVAGQEKALGPGAGRGRQGKPATRGGCDSGGTSLPAQIARFQRLEELRPSHRIQQIHGRRLPRVAGLLGLGGEDI